MTDETLHRVETSLSGYELLNDPLLNKGTAFTEAERDEFDLHGLLPPQVAQLDSQVKRRFERRQIHDQATSASKSAMVHLSAQPRAGHRCHGSVCCSNYWTKMRRSHAPFRDRIN